ncbi:MAG: AAA family ATPase [Planctomyces sp.]|nr:AAA family ATPase [Planctomyces sp.]
MTTLRELVLGRNPIISLQTLDERTEFDQIRLLAAELNRNLYDWTMADGIRVFSPNTPNPAEVSGTDKPDRAIRQIMMQKRPTLSCFRGMASMSSQPLVQRLLRDYTEHADTDRECLILLDDEPLHPRIQRLAVPYRPGLPGTEELDRIVKETLLRLKKSGTTELSTDLKKSEFEQIVLTLRGLTRTEATRVIESVVMSDHKLCRNDIAHVIDAKRRLLEGAGALESITVDFDISEVGGLGGLKKWLTERRGGFSRKAKEFGISPPRGILMLGVPGCGKSLCAKAVAADWQMPLLRLDPGVLYQKFVGESENQLRQAISQAEAMAPVILWIDEIEKAFASASSASADGGLSQRMFGTLLSWMQDHREPIFMIATANDISALPPELMRKGRFDEVFFIDLPNSVARKQIFSIHLKRRGRNPEKFDLDQLSDASKDLTGSEIEQAIVSSLFRAFTAGRELETADIIYAVSITRPLAALMSERIESLRTWAFHRCVMAD